MLPRIQNPASIDLTRMECKAETNKSFIDKFLGIDLTRMECKVVSLHYLQQTLNRIDLTRMECKAENKDI